jgi:alpha-galactosidase
MRDALAKTGRPIVYSICSWGEEHVEQWGGETGNLWRTTGDISDNFHSFLSILDKQVGLEQYAKAGGWNDPDMLEVGNGGMTDNEYQAHFALWALLKAPLIIGCDITKMSEATKKILMNENIIRINQDSLGKQGKRYKQHYTLFGKLDIWAGELSNGHAIILFNRSLFKTKMTVKFNEVGYKFPGGNLQNLITDENYGYVNESFSIDVESHSVVVLKLHTYCNENNSINCIETK